MNKKLGISKSNFSFHNIEKGIAIWGKDQENAERLQVFLK